MEWKKLPRRRFLQLLLMGGGGFLLIKTMPGGWPKEKFLCLSAWNLDPLRALARVVLPEEISGMPTPEAADVFKRLDEELFFCEKQIRSDFRDALTLAEWYPFLLGKYSRLSRMNTASATEVVNIGLHSSNDLVRAAFSNLRMVIILLYYGHPSTWEKIGYDGPFAAMPEKWSEQRSYYKTRTED